MEHAIGAIGSGRLASEGHMHFIMRHGETALAQFLRALPADFMARIARGHLPKDPAVIIWWVLAIVIVMINVPASMVSGSLPLTIAVAIAGSGGCAWTWLLTRTLFRPGVEIEPWNFAVVAGVSGVIAVARLSPTLAAAGVNGEVLRIVHNAEMVFCLTAIALVFVEALAGYSNRLTITERRFRQTYIALYAGMIVFAIIWGAGIHEAGYGEHLGGRIVLLSGLFTIVGSRVAVEFRRRHPLPAELTSSGAPIKPAKPSATRAADPALAKRILQTIEDANFFTRPDLKVGDMAAELGVQEYLVTQCITGDLGFRNFNHLINSHRVSHAKLQLRDRATQEKRISSIAFDCGFNSIGTFNRTFKQQVGVTPREFREAEGGSEN
ncbi:MAG: helix-turn-helix transcriptional regulator [Pseudomonadota bacterium]